MAGEAQRPWHGNCDASVEVDEVEGCPDWIQAPWGCNTVHLPEEPHVGWMVDDKFQGLVGPAFMWTDATKPVMIAEDEAEWFPTSIEHLKFVNIQRKELEQCATELLGLCLAAGIDHEAIEKAKAFLSGE